MVSSNNEQSIDLTAAQADAVQKALRHWSHSKLISSNLVSDLLATIQVVEEPHTFNWERFAKYTFRFAIICFAIAVVSLVFDNVFKKIIKRILALSATMRIIVTSGLAVAMHVWGLQRSIMVPQQQYLNEATHSLGAMLFALTALQLSSTLETNRPENSHILHRIELSLAVVYGSVAVLVQSNFIWSCGMIILGTWFGSWTAYSSGVYEIGMNYPLRFVLFGAGIIAASESMRNYPLTATLWSTTRTWGMLYMFVALWLLSLFGNDKLLGGTKAHHGGSGRIAFWSFMFLCAAATAIWHGLRYSDSTTKGFGLTFVGINFYSKFFEFFWATWYKTVFFAVLSLSLGILGKYAESVNIALDRHYASISG
ncbi:hypothetical protein F5Y19DRAFT_444956 [Xylariaceae sp. FL1651]|nr:hypothetical protein F5Y19DRAFT_444956 [Xylariaceae sp. FL1651]